MEWWLNDGTRNNPYHPWNEPGNIPAQGIAGGYTVKNEHSGMVSAVAEIYPGGSAVGIVGARHPDIRREAELQPAQQKPAGCGAMHLYRLQNKKLVHHGVIWGFTDVTVKPFTPVMNGRCYFGKRLQCL